MTMITPSSGDRVPDACTLPTAERPVRVAEFDRFFAESVQRADRLARTRLDLLLAADAEPAGRDLAARESACCSFFAFTFDATAAGPVMRIEVPDTQVEVLDALAMRVDAALGGDRR
ncbi:hypothetical protein [Nocardia lijiangensis]|uniref:hypothetical protein n=1 Tax=Nocardia lijiangensis TaxID=299618 RepID=UPI0008308F25|nr:hypothetical protein [Nocardia lijiangensis]